MLNISSTVLEKLAIWRNPNPVIESSSRMDIHLVNQNDIFYKKGRTLANQVYNQVWGTEKLIDDNDYGIVITNQGEVVGNLNIQLKKEHKALKSEKFFGQKHWENCCNLSGENIFEISGLSIGKEVHQDLRQPILMLLMFSKYTLVRSLGKTFGVSVQRKALNRIITKHLHLPFFANPEITEVQGEVPQDAYWQDGEQPQLYYLDYTNPGTIESMNSYLFYLNSIGIQTSFMSRFHPQPTSYAKFRKFSEPRLIAV
ncbi:hypothetical protein [Gloeocapsa sp. PCC 73106]|uniref:hypothetical protein n=1 Tax=Gloeocapsa sp. PCC 73106 TaxID=102232 RepID=UPI0002ABF786|nr:hypothetical protein [Gloeocapsa sp. PCC 73106]ELR98202.1 hypothetical protein GLO73106DRAFT_00020290 [Gloeocapsa sp. PCC 73106]